MADASLKNHPFPTSVKIVLACVLIVLIVAGASFEYSRPLQSAMATTTTGVTQGPVIVTTTSQSAGGLLQFNSSIGFSGVGKSQYSVIFNHPANVVITLCIMSQYNLPNSVTASGAVSDTFNLLGSQSTSALNQSPYGLWEWISENTSDVITVNYPSEDNMVLAAMAFTGRGATTGIENYSAGGWSSINPFSVTQGSGNIAGRMNSYFALTFNDQSGTTPDIALDGQIIPVGGFRQSQNGSRLMTIRIGYIPDDNMTIITQYRSIDAGAGAVAFVGIDPK